MWDKGELTLNLGLTGGSDGNESACNAGDPGLIPESGRSPGEGKANPLQYSCLENSIFISRIPLTENTVEQQGESLPNELTCNAKIKFLGEGSHVWWAVRNVI